MKRWLSRIVVAVVIVIAAVYCLALGNIWLNENVLVFPGADPEAEGTLNLARSGSALWDTVRVRTEDGVRILLLESRQSATPEAPWVIYFYGQEGQVADRWNLARYDLFRTVGLNVLAVEYRGYGASEKVQPTEAGVYADARAAWCYLAKTWEVPASRVLLYGYSLGSGVAIQLATEATPAGLITEGAFTSLPDAVRAHYPWLPAGLVMQNRFENLEKARSLSLPWLLFHGRQDSKIPFEHAERLAGTSAGSRRLVSLESGHDDAPFADRDGMEKGIEEFVGRLFGSEHGL